MGILCTDVNNEVFGFLQFCGEIALPIRTRFCPFVFLDAISLASLALTPLCRYIRPTQSDSGQHSYILSCMLIVGLFYPFCQVYVFKCQSNPIFFSSKSTFESLFLQGIMNIALGDQNLCSLHPAQNGIQSRPHFGKNIQHLFPLSLFPKTMPRKIINDVELLLKYLIHWDGIIYSGVG